MMYNYLGNTEEIKTIIGIGSILLSDNQIGKIYKDGEYVCTLPFLEYGYNLKGYSKKLFDDLNKECCTTMLEGIYRLTSLMWRYSSKYSYIAKSMYEDKKEFKYINLAKQRQLEISKVKLDLDIDDSISIELNSLYEHIYGSNYNVTTDLRSVLTSEVSDSIVYGTFIVVDYINRYKRIKSGG